jgi:hypothetical protein
MKGHKDMKTLTNIIHPALALFAFACFALSPQARATCQDACLTNNNTVQGDDALISLTTGTDNTANGAGALFSNTEGNYNTANGFHALLSSTTGSWNTANGFQALASNTTGNGNTANGEGALRFNTEGSDNVANGNWALHENTTGELNNAFGIQALFTNTTGHRNTAISYQALYSNITGYRNTAVGGISLFSSTTGNFNTAYGWSSLLNSATGDLNIAIGPAAGQNVLTGSNNVAIGNPGGTGDESNTIRIGSVVPFTDIIGQVHPAHTATYVAGINGTTVAKSVSVFVDFNGRLGTKTSSQRFKDEIKPMDTASEAILALKPVTFRYKREIDPEGIPQFGLVAEDVEKVSPALVARDADGKVYTVAMKQ